MHSSSRWVHTDGRTFSVFAADGNEIPVFYSNYPDSVLLHATRV
jgi:hypothetical protein